MQNAVPLSSPKRDINFEKKCSLRQPEFEVKKSPNLISAWATPQTLLGDIPKRFELDVACS